MKILHAPDLHSVYDNYGKVGSDGVHSRLAEWRKCADTILETAIRENVDVAVFPGDIFRTSRPRAMEQIEVYSLFDKLRREKIKVVAIAGNHDLVAPGEPSAVDVLSRVGEKSFGVTMPKIVTAKDVQFVCLPSVKAAAINAACSDPAEAATMVSNKLMDIARSMRALCDDRPKVLVGHWNITGSATSSGQYMLGGHEPTLMLSELLSLEFDAYLFGHIHKPQVLHERPFVGYAGAMQRVDFGEEDDDRGFYIHDLERGETHWHALPAIAFHTLSLDENFQITGLSQVTGNIVRVKYQVREDDAAKIDHGKIVGQIKEMEPLYFAGIFPEIIKTDRKRSAGLTEQTGPLEALSMWLATKSDIKEETRERLMALGKQLHEEVVQNATS